jgi:hypothetical protein
LEKLKEELMEHAPPQPDVARPRLRRRPQLRGAWVAVAAFLAVVLVGGVTWILQPSAPSAADRPLTATDWDLMITLPVVEDADILVSEIESLPGVVDAQYFPDARTLQSTQAPPTGEFGIAAILIRLDSPDSAEKVATSIATNYGEGFRATYSDEIARRLADGYFDFASVGATILGEDPRMLQPPVGPQPEFDTSGLGTQLSMIPAESGDDIPDTFFAQAQAPRMGEHVLNPKRPVIHVGYLEGIDTRLIVYGTNSNGYCVSADGGTACGDFSQYPYGVVMSGTGSGGGDVSVRVPEGTSVVRLSIDGSEAQWQRPRGGWALFPLTVLEPALFTVEAYDANGGLIGQWEQRG